jgi:hypothetical protein
MLKKILSCKACAQCRICCVFDDSDIWEAPLISDETKENILKINPTQEFQTNGSSRIMKMEKGENGLYFCPMLGENGCLLGDEKPFDCKIWPFRVMEFCGMKVITLSPVCPELFKKPIGELISFLEDGLAERIFEEAEKFPQMVKKYIPNYPILAVK